MRSYSLFAHSGSYNHGCEAIVRSTIKILSEDDSVFSLYSENPSEDLKFSLDNIASVNKQEEYVQIKSNSCNGLILRLKSKLNKNLTYDRAEFIANNKYLVKKNTVALSIGGDNYCYKGIIDKLTPIIYTLKYFHIPSVLWGCSIGKEYLNENVVEDIKKYTLITARESLTIENLYDCGIKENIIAVADPAFALDSEQTDFNKQIFDSGNIIGLNVSDFMKWYEPYKDATYKNFLRLIEYLLKTTDSYIALIPHVNKTSEANDDYFACKKLATEINNYRIIVVDDSLNCMQLKYLISKCKMFIGCRTHSTIAAYSTCVPTLVVGYSVKSRGIAKDIFGDDKGLVVDGRRFSSDEDLTNAFINFSEREKELKKRLIDFMPEYIARAYNGKEAVEKLFCK